MEKTIGNLRHPDRYFGNLWAFDMFNDCFKGKIRPTDIDGCVERNRKFLFIEGKKGDPFELPVGQSIMLHRLAEKPGITVLIWWGNPPSVINSMQFLHGKYESLINNCTTEDVKDFMRKWWDWADIRENDEPFDPDPDIL